MPEPTSGPSRPTSLQLADKAIAAAYDLEAEVARLDKAAAASRDQAIAASDLRIRLAGIRDHLDATEAELTLLRGHLHALDTGQPFTRPGRPRRATLTRELGRAARRWRPRVCRLSGHVPDGPLPWCRRCGTDLGEDR